MSEKTLNIYKGYALNKFRAYPNPKSRAEEWLDRFFGGQALQI